MSERNFKNLAEVSMTDLFRREIESQSLILTRGLLSLERDTSPEVLSELMRAAHSLKGAARIVGCHAAVHITHAMEDCLVAAQKQHIDIDKYVDALLSGVDLLGRIGDFCEQELGEWGAEHQAEIELLIASLQPGSEAQPGLGKMTTGAQSLSTQEAKESPDAAVSWKTIPQESTRLVAGRDRALRITADNLNRVLGLAGETLIASRWLTSFVADMKQMKRLNRDLEHTSERLRESLAEIPINSKAARAIDDLRDKVAQCHSYLSKHSGELDLFDQRFSSISTRLYQKVIDCRMRPFGEGIEGFPRLVRDLARSLGKSVKFEISGEETLVDRDILALVKDPISHLLRNAVDHGIELKSDRLGAGKPEEATIRLEAGHSAGKLLITVSDDGFGIDPEKIRTAVVGKKLTTDDMALKMSDQELMEFLFLPGFTLRDTLSEISGRGVGLDVVQVAVKEASGTVRISSKWGKGTSFQLELPLTLSVARTLVVEMGGEPYAFPLARIDRTLKLPIDQLQSIEGRQHFTLDGQQIGIVPGSEILELGAQSHGGDLSVVVLGNKSGRFGLIVDKFLGERELVVRPLDPRLGKVKNVSAGALMPDGSPLLIVDMDDLIREIEGFLSGRRLTQIGAAASGTSTKDQKRVLVVDDSLTVRELERKLLDSCGYTVDVAVDGIDGWNAVRTGNYDLVLTDVDMPRLDGIELVNLIRKDNRLKSLPVMIVSYKERPEDRQRGLEAGADYYLTKGSFHDETLMRAVVDLIGEATA